MAKIILQDKITTEKVIDAGRDPARYRDKTPPEVLKGQTISVIMRIDGVVSRELEYIVPVDAPEGMVQVANLKLETVYGKKAEPE